MDQLRSQKEIYIALELTKCGYRRTILVPEFPMIILSYESVPEFVLTKMCSKFTAQGL
jgi:hypothetical protein